MISPATSTVKSPLDKANVVPSIVILSIVTPPSSVKAVAFGIIAAVIEFAASWSDKAPAAICLAKIWLFAIFVASIELSAMFAAVNEFTATTLVVILVNAMLSFWVFVLYCFYINFPRIYAFVIYFI